ncbi:MAG: ABC transporter ATP-binding protein [bacterium]
MQLDAQGIVVEVRGKRLLDRIDFSCAQGELVVVLGPNGAGKSTLLRSLLGLQKVSCGAVHLDAQPVESFSDQNRAIRVSYLPQQRELVWPNRVEDVVALGRYAHGAHIGRLGPQDEAAIEQAIEFCALQELRHRHLDTLSGGELARVHCARVFASAAPLIVADEPVAGLDLYHQHALMALFRGVVAQGRGVLLVLHDINLALTYADRIVWIDAGCIVGEHQPHEVTEEFVANLFAVNVTASQLDQQVHMLFPGQVDPSTERR